MSITTQFKKMKSLSFLEGFLNKHVSHFNLLLTNGNANFTIIKKTSLFNFLMAGVHTALLH